MRQFAPHIVVLGFFVFLVLIGVTTNSGVIGALLGGITMSAVDPFVLIAAGAIGLLVKRQTLLPMALVIFGVAVPFVIGFIHQSQGFSPAPISQFVVVSKIGAALLIGYTLNLLRVRGRKGRPDSASHINTPTPVAPGTEQGGPPPDSKIEDIVRDLHDQMRHAVALMQMHRVLAYSPDVTPLFNDTREAWGYSVVQQSVLVELVFALCRLHDRSHNTNSLPTLFNEEAAISESKRWISTLPGPRRDAFAEAKSTWSQLRGSHLLCRLRTLRHKFWGHSATDRTGLQMPKYGYVDDLYNRTKEIVELLSFAALDTDPNFDDAEQVWEQHANRFFQVLTAGQRGAQRS